MYKILSRLSDNDGPLSSKRIRIEVVTPSLPPAYWYLADNPVAMILAKTDHLIENPLSMSYLSKSERADVERFFNAFINSVMERCEEISVSLGSEVYDLKLGTLIGIRDLFVVGPQSLSQEEASCMIRLPILFLTLCQDMIAKKASVTEILSTLLNVSSFNQLSDELTARLLTLENETRPYL
jgi:hypothetical protein